MSPAGRSGDSGYGLGLSGFWLSGTGAASSASRFFAGGLWGT
jgi:hypothetical protein